MVTAPALTPVTTPEEDTVAILLSLELHVTFALVGYTVAPMETVEPFLTARLELSNSMDGVFTVTFQVDL